MPLPDPERGIRRWMAVRGYALRAAELAGAAAGPVTSVALLIAGCALLGVAAAGGGGAVVAIVLAAVLVVAVIACCDRMALSAMLARPVSEVEHPELYRLVRELSKDGRLPVPRLYLSPAEQPNSFAVGRGPRSAGICCTEGLLRVLDEAELRGVLGHEIAHVSGHDLLGSSMSAGLATVITFPAGLARLARLPRPGPAGSSGSSGSAKSAGSGRGLGALEQALMLLFGPVAAVIVRLAVSQEREYRADAAGALLSGDPVALAGALRKIDAGTAELALAPDGRRISVGHLMIASPFRLEGLARLFRTHPPAGERVRRLEALAGYRR
ncbi:MAG TPA: M48 family metalloprotease [Streptosporangiaceae bacterium]|nr:M48 family metalloprotease [Streptosporangiaceae bacterium]